MLAPCLTQSLRARGQVGSAATSTSSSASAERWLDATPSAVVVDAAGRTETVCAPRLRHRCGEHCKTRRNRLATPPAFSSTPEPGRATGQGPAPSLRSVAPTNQPHVARNARGCDSLTASSLAAPVSPKRQRLRAFGSRRRRGRSPPATLGCWTVRSPSHASQPALCAPRRGGGGATASLRGPTA
jgi:hypothetical protein